MAGTCYSGLGWFRWSIIYLCQERGKTAFLFSNHTVLVAQTAQKDCAEMTLSLHNEIIEQFALKTISNKQLKMNKLTPEQIINLHLFNVRPNGMERFQRETQRIVPL